MEVKAVYSVVELAEASGMTRKLMLKALKSAGVPIRHRGRRFAVYLSDLHRASDLWQSILDAAAERDLLQASDASE